MMQANDLLFDQETGTSFSSYKTYGNADASKDAHAMGEYARAFQGIAGAVSAFSKYGAMMDKADAEAENADFYRAQATFAAEAGERRKAIFDRQSHVLHGAQLAGFAKAGVDTGQSSFFIASQMLERSQESWAITREEQMNVQLAQLRADAADRNASDLRSGAPLQAAVSLASTAAIAFI